MLRPWFTTRTAGAWPYLLIALAGLMFVGAVWSSHRSAIQQTDAMSGRLAAAVALDVARALDQVDRTLQAVISRHQSAPLQDQDAQARDAPLFERAQRDPYFAFINVLDEHGGVIAALPPNDSRWKSRDYFWELQGGAPDSLSFGRPFSTERENLVGFPVGRRLTDSGGKFAGVAVMGVRLGYFRDLLSHLELGPHASVTLLRDDGVILMRLPFDLNDVARTLDLAAPPYASVRKGLMPATAVDPLDHIERRYMFRRVGTLPMVVSIGTPTNDIYAGSLLWWLGSAGSTIIVAVAYLTLRWQREQRQRAAAERENAEKSRFLTMLSHELRTPLHGVLGYADQLVHEGALNPAQSYQVAEIVRAGRHMRDVVNVVLDYARIEALGPALHMRVIDVRQLAEECLAVVGPSAKARGLEMRISVAQGAPAHFVTDDVQLRQILMNLLSNAVKYTVRGTVELRLMGNAERLTIEVADTGIGIPANYRHRLFKEFERFGTEHTTTEGTGLGLAIAHRLARRMGGNMGHRDNAGGGSVFWLDLPAGVADRPVLATELARGQPDRPLHVLIVDDSKVNREVAAAFLRQAGHVATEAHDGAEAVQLAAAQDFDVVLMDMRMAGVDGLEATRRIRAFEGPRALVPIVAVTANALDQHAEECRRAGMSEYLAKPFTQTELLAVVSRATSHGLQVAADRSPAFDLDSMTQLAACMSADSLQGLLDCLSLRTEALLRRLDEPSPFAAPETLVELVHELAGSAGALGFARLSALASRFELAITANPAEARRLAADVQCEAKAALKELRQRRALADVAPA